VVPARRRRYPGAPERSIGAPASTAIDSIITAVSTAAGVSASVAASATNQASRAK
jgi:hypothetical protein